LTAVRGRVFHGAVKASSPLRALVADDEPAMLTLNAGFLRQKGFDVTEADDGERAWELAQSGRFDLVLLDVMMPGMSGWEVCKRIKHTPMTKGTAVVMLTGIGDTLNDATSPLFAADAWLDKPYDFTELSRRLREALAKFGKAMPDGDSSFYVSNDAPPPSLPRAAAKKAAPKKAAPKKAAPKKAAPKKAAPKKAAPKKAAPKKAAPKKAAPKKAAPKKAAPKKAAPKKAAPKKR
jgi:CheY-like chemotaxis protein